MGTPIGGKGHTSPLVGTEKVPLSPDGYATTQEVADLATGGGGQTLVIANDVDVIVAAIPGATIVIYENLTDHRTVTLPPAASASMTVWIVDVVGRPIENTSKSITLVPDGADTVPFTDVRGAVMLANDEVDAWTNLSPKFPLVYDDGTVTHSISVETIGAHEIRFQSKVNGSALGNSVAYVDIDAVDADQTNVQIGVGDSGGLGPTLQLTSAGGGAVYLLNIPTTDPLAAGQLYQSFGVLQISAG